MPLKETLVRLREERQDEWESTKPKQIAQWQQAVENLFSDIRGYLAEYEADGSISFSEGEIDLTEEALGSYRVREMAIIAGPAIVMLVPVGTMLVSAWGRVDMYRQGRSGEQDRVVLLRLKASPKDPTLQWKVRVPPKYGRARRPSPLQSEETTFLPLSKDIFEERLDSLLRA